MQRSSHHAPVPGYNVTFGNFPRAFSSTSYKDAVEDIQDNDDLRGTSVSQKFSRTLPTSSYHAPARVCPSSAISG